MVFYSGDEEGGWLGCIRLKVVGSRRRGLSNIPVDKYQTYT